LLPSHQPVSCGSVEEVMFPRALPDEVPGVLGVHADRPAPAAVIGVESPLERLLEVALPVHYGITVIARFGRHETDAIHAPVLRVAKAFHRPSPVSIRGLEPAGERRVREWILHIG